MSKTKGQNVQNKKAADVQIDGQKSYISWNVHLF